MDAPKAFELRNVGVRFDGFPALLGLNLEVRRGECLAFVGPSGSGKTSALGVLNGMVPPATGSVRIREVDLSSIGTRGMRKLRVEIGVIPQDLGLVPNVRVYQNVMAGRLGRQSLIGSLRRLIRTPRSELQEVMHFLKRLGIANKIFQRTDSLSGGERQRVAIARSLYQGANTILADEPLSALDPARARETLALLVDIARENHMTLVLSMHDLALAREFIPRLIGLKDGAVLFDRATGDISPEEFEELYNLESKERHG